MGDAAMIHTFRFDDICLNTDLEAAGRMSGFLKERFPDAPLLWCVSPLVHDMSCEQDSVKRQRVFPAILNAHSDHRLMYRIDLAGLPKTPPNVEICSHGLVHIDHRLMGREAQELSIVASCSLLKCKVFVPPFNKWNADTESVCQEHGIRLVKFEDGWLSMEHNAWQPQHALWYCHPRAFTVGTFQEWFE